MIKLLSKYFHILRYLFKIYLLWQNFSAFVHVHLKAFETTVQPKYGLFGRTVPQNISKLTALFKQSNVRVQTTLRCTVITKPVSIFPNLRSTRTDLGKVKKSGDCWKRSSALIIYRMAQSIQFLNQICTYQRYIF